MVLRLFLSFSSHPTLSWMHLNLHICKILVLLWDFTANVGNGDTWRLGRASQIWPQVVKCLWLLYKALIVKNSHFIQTHHVHKCNSYLKTLCPRSAINVWLYYQTWDRYILDSQIREGQSCALIKWSFGFVILVCKILVKILRDEKFCGETEASPLNGSWRCVLGQWHSEQLSKVQMLSLQEREAEICRSAWGVTRYFEGIGQSLGCLDNRYLNLGLRRRNVGFTSGSWNVDQLFFLHSFVRGFMRVC